MDDALQPGTVLPATTFSDLGSMGGRFRVLYFMRSVTCAVCRGHVLLLSKRQDKLKTLAADVIVLTPEDQSDASALEKELGLPFPVRSSRAAYETMQLTKKLFGTFQQSGTLVTDAAGVVLLVRRTTIPFNALNERELFAALEAKAPA
jgi:peroxiredoxin